jgi:bifunctional ADP-heptose synthase (sugar kinase/adenylyltransferase)
MSGKQVLFRLNRFRQEGVSKEIVKEIESIFSNLIERHDAVIFADFSYGVLNENNSQNLMKIAKARGLFTAADSQTSSQIGDLSKFIGADLITPTEREARQELRNQEGLVVLSHKLMEKLGSKFIMLKLGADGVLLSGEKLRSDYLPALNQEPVDVAGAGDSLLAISSLAITAGASLYVAGLLGNVAAAIQVSREGNLPITSSDVLEFFSQLP